MAASYECPECHTCWPYSPRYTRCVECDKPCITASVPRPMTMAEAAERRLRIDFIRFCNQRDEKRKRLGHPSPEELGRKEAEEIIRAAREIHALPET
jgi:hypothetical protein